MIRFIYDKDPYEARYQSLIKKQYSADLTHLNYSKAVIEYSNNMDDIHKNVDEYNPNKKPKMLIVYDHMIADILNNKNLNP